MYVAPAPHIPSVDPQLADHDIPTQTNRRPERETTGSGKCQPAAVTAHAELFAQRSPLPVDSYTIGLEKRRG
jgi:hypothetical protein